MPADARRAAVLHVAVAEFARTGLHGTSTENIAAGADISHPYLFPPVRHEEGAVPRVPRPVPRAPARDVHGRGRGGGRRRPPRWRWARRTSTCSPTARCCCSSSRATPRARRPDVRATASDGYAELWQLVTRLSGAPEDEVRALLRDRDAAQHGRGDGPAADRRRPGGRSRTCARRPRADRSVSRAAPTAAPGRPRAALRPRGNRSGAPSARRGRYAAARSFAGSASGARDACDHVRSGTSGSASASTSATSPSGTAATKTPCSASASAAWTPADSPPGTLAPPPSRRSVSTRAAPAGRGAPAARSRGGSRAASRARRPRGCRPSSGRTGSSPSRCRGSTPRPRSAWR